MIGHLAQTADAGYNRATDSLEAQQDLFNSFYDLNGSGTAPNIAGLLGTEIGGRSTNPYQPGDLWSELSQRSDSASL